VPAGASEPPQPARPSALTQVNKARSLWRVEGVIWGSVAIKKMPDIQAYKK
jgi:anti-sigma factor ChrR (cupin superfamily)